METMEALQVIGVSRKEDLINVRYASGHVIVWSKGWGTPKAFKDPQHALLKGLSEEHPWGEFQELDEHNKPVDPFA